MPAIVVLTTVPGAAAARKLARWLVRERVAACVSYREGFESCYRWKGKIRRAKEALLIIKSHSRVYSRLKRSIESAHPYKVPEIVSIAAKDVAAPYLEWLKGSLK
jgi:periplasmic divalent cation tolerance protein